MSPANSVLSSLLESGLPSHWFDAALPNRTECDTLSEVRASRTRTSFSHRSGMGLKGLAGVFLAAAAGLAAAAAAFAAEAAVSQGKRRWRKRRKDRRYVAQPLKQCGCTVE